MRFWDSSALVPLVVDQAATNLVMALFERDPAMFVWWGTEVECVSALARLERERAIDRIRAEDAHGRLKALADAWGEVEPSQIVRECAIRFLRVHALRAADALQLAAAIVAAELRPSSLEMVTLDDRLADVARKEGFRLAAPAPL